MDDKLLIKIKMLPVYKESQIIIRRDNQIRPINPLEIAAIKNLLAYHGKRVPVSNHSAVSAWFEFRPDLKP